MCVGAWVCESRRVSKEDLMGHQRCDVSIIGTLVYRRRHHQNHTVNRRVSTPLTVAGGGPSAKATSSVLLLFTFILSFEGMINYQMEVRD